MISFWHFFTLYDLFYLYNFSLIYGLCNGNVKFIKQKISDIFLCGEIIEHPSFCFRKLAFTHVDKVTMIHGKMRGKGVINFHPSSNAANRSFLKATVHSWVFEHRSRTHHSCKNRVSTYMSKEKGLKLKVSGVI